MIETKTAKQAMSRGLVTLRPEMDVLEALRILIEQRLSGAPVTDQVGNLVGILTERDCMQIALGAGYYSEDGGHVANFMSPDVVTVDANTPVTEVAERFASSNFRRLPVMEQGRLIGIISRRDVLKQLEVAWQPDRHRI
ncbi:CBS domain-containing protein [Halochromatium glycolicum]|uniref:CBS domain-containing protein n=1 Tax=Halochromatium glycolicum TaxID=85075 RepID=A0AAJ0U538_9GAMM|nr:CBS domain-containing protein [Halochromatium glycolicum]MBK1705283.1 CBS domain-containing protein [Halochromatium glycolicum]